MGSDKLINLIEFSGNIFVDRRQYLIIVLIWGFILVRGWMLFFCLPVNLIVKNLRFDSARRAREHHKCNWLIVLFLIEDVIEPELEKG